MNCKMQALKEEVRDEEKRRRMEMRVKKRNPKLLPSNKNISHIEEVRGDRNRERFMSHFRLNFDFFFSFLLLLSYRLNQKEI